MILKTRVKATLVTAGAGIGVAMTMLPAMAAPTETMSATDAGAIIDTVYDAALPFVKTYLPILMSLAIVVGLTLWAFRKLRGAVVGRG